MILDTILEKKKETLEQDLQRSITIPTRIASAMKEKEDLFVIGELKKASPSKGILVEDFQIASLARGYDTAGVDAISVLTEQNFFLGDVTYLTQVRQLTPLPILRKDFIIDMRELLQSANYGATMVLLIVAILSDEQLLLFYQCASLLALECIVEVHNEEEVQRALAIKPQIIGINNRDLHTFDVSLSTTKRLASLIPDHIAIVSESGIFTHEDMEEVKRAGADAVLIGESFMRASDMRQHLQQLHYGKD